MGDWEETGKGLGDERVVTAPHRVFFARCAPYVHQLFGHESITIDCPGDLADSVQRLATATSGNTIVKWSDTMMSGFISEHYVYLLKQTTMSSGGFRLRFVGRFEEAEDAGTATLIGRFLFPWSAIALFLVAITVCVAWLLKAAATMLFMGGPVDDVGHAAIAFTGVVAFWFITRALGARDKRWLLGRIEAALGVAEGHSQ